MQQLGGKLMAGTDLAGAQEDNLAREDELQHSVTRLDALIVLIQHLQAATMAMSELHCTVLSDLLDYSNTHHLGT